MLSTFKNRIIAAFPSDDPPDASHNEPKDKFPYARPEFLQLLTPDELRASADHKVRPIIVPRDINLLPWGTGYAECVNAGKSKWNEDQAAFSRHVLSSCDLACPSIPYTYFGIFDGHAGYGAALTASIQFQHQLFQNLLDCVDLLVLEEKETDKFHQGFFEQRVSKDELIIGALESAFANMDALIGNDSTRYQKTGGCTACVVLFINGKMYVSNAGDSRAVLCHRRPPADLTSVSTTVPVPLPVPVTKEQKTTTKTTREKVSSIETQNIGVISATPLSFDHTPETERERLMNVGILRPNLMGQYYVAQQYARRPRSNDFGRRILCRSGNMKGWAFKTVDESDYRMPLVTGEGKRSRLLGTLGVTRGFGDHLLKAIHTDVAIKPFLTAHPDIVQRDLSQVVNTDESNVDGDFGVLVMGTDGLWDVSENEAVANTVFQMLSRYPNEKYRYTMAAQELVARARGKITDAGHWRLADSSAPATVDDISVIVIPVYQYYKEHVEWTKKCQIELEKRQQKEQSDCGEAFETAQVVEELPKQELQVQVEVEVEKQQSTTDLEPEETLVIELKGEKTLQARIETVGAVVEQLKLKDGGEVETAKQA